MLRIQDEGNENVDICVAKSQDIRHFPSLPRLKEAHQENNGASQLLMQQCYVAPRGPWQPIQLDVMQEPNSQFQAYAHPPQSNYNTSFPWKHWPSQPQNHSWQQGWQGTYSSHQKYP